MILWLYNYLNYLERTFSSAAEENYKNYALASLTGRPAPKMAHLNRSKQLIKGWWS